MFPAGARVTDLLGIRAAVARLMRERSFLIGARGGDTSAVPASKRWQRYRAKSIRSMDQTPPSYGRACHSLISRCLLLIRKRTSLLKPRRIKDIYLVCKYEIFFVIE